jgi:hypothetical protein
MWSYYGSKSKIVKYYPIPRYAHIIEPFAGTAQYAMRYWEHEVTLVDKYSIITDMWKWLQKCSEGDLRGLPRLKEGESLDDFTFDCKKAKWFMGMIITGGPTQPKKTPSAWKVTIRPNTQNYKIEQACKNLHKIKHWRVIEADYLSLDNEKATWFIDPPYYVGGKYYVHSKIDYEQLAIWCASRKGQVLVCENSKASWLPFSPLVQMTGVRYRTTECLWEKDNL